MLAPHSTCSVAQLRAPMSKWWALPLSVEPNSAIDLQHYRNSTRRLYKSGASNHGLRTISPSWRWTLTTKMARRCCTWFRAAFPTATLNEQWRAGNRTSGNEWKLSSGGNTKYLITNRLPFFFFEFFKPKGFIPLWSGFVDFLISQPQ